MHLRFRYRNICYVLVEIKTGLTTVGNQGPLAIGQYLVILEHGNSLSYEQSGVNIQLRSVSDCYVRDEMFRHCVGFLERMRRDQSNH
jgi:hypothetical protein